MALERKAGSHGWEVGLGPGAEVQGAGVWGWEPGDLGPEAS